MPGARRELYLGGCSNFCSRFCSTSRSPPRSRSRSFVSFTFTLTSIANAVVHEDYKLPQESRLYFEDCPIRMHDLAFDMHAQSTDSF